MKACNLKGKLFHLSNITSTFFLVNMLMKVLVLGIGKMEYGILKDLDAQPNVSEIVAA